MNNQPDTAHIDVNYVAELARLKLAPQEQVLFQKQLDEILQYVHQLSQIDISGIEPMAHTFPITNIFRSDATRPCLPNDVVLKNAPATSQNQYLVPKIIE